jgi:hypothetical protein
VTDSFEDAVAFDRFLAASTPEVAAIARALRQAVLDALPAAIERFDPGKRARHVKVRSVADTDTPWLSAVIAAQIDHRTTAGHNPHLEVPRA